MHWETEQKKFSQNSPSFPALTELMIANRNKLFCITIGAALLGIGAVLSQVHSNDSEKLKQKERYFFGSRNSAIQE